MALQKPDFEKDKVYLFQFTRAKCIPSASPYCLKLETWLRMADVNYENIATMSGKSTKGQKPFVELNGKQIADSTFIIEELSKHFNKPLEGNMSEHERAQAHMAAIMFEQSVVWQMVYFRSLDMETALFGPEAMGDALTRTQKLGMPVFKMFMTHSVRGRLQAQGYGRNTTEENVKLTLDNLKAFSAHLGSKKYIGGDVLTRYDATVWAHMACLYFTPLKNDVKKFLNEDEKHANLKAYLQRVKTELWPDWEAVTTELKINTDWKTYKNKK